MDTKPVDLSHVQFGPKAMACTPLERRFAYVLGAGLATSVSDAAALAGIVLRVPPALRDAVARVAAAEDRSLAYAARKLLERAVAAQEQTVA
jgi:hypothetical protein